MAWLISSQETPKIAHFALPLSLSLSPPTSCCPGNRKFYLRNVPFLPGNVCFPLPGTRILLPPSSFENTFADTRNAGGHSHSRWENRSNMLPPRKTPIHQRDISRLERIVLASSRKFSSLRIYTCMVSSPSCLFLCAIISRWWTAFQVKIFRLTVFSFSKIRPDI